jgi:hypothetical protein
MRCLPSILQTFKRRDHRFVRMNEFKFQCLDQDTKKRASRMPQIASDISCASCRCFVHVICLGMLCLCVRFVVCFSYTFVRTITPKGGQWYTVTFSNFTKIVFFCQRFNFFHLYHVNVDYIYFLDELSDY